MTIKEQRDAWRECAEQLKDALGIALNCNAQSKGERKDCCESLATFERLTAEANAAPSGPVAVLEPENRVLANWLRAPSLVPNPNGCHCHECNPHVGWMIVCAKCGNKRCPHATNHDLACTNSNAPGQKGSLYE